MEFVPTPAFHTEPHSVTKLSGSHANAAGEESLTAS
jgi:hypothetical protein